MASSHIEIDDVKNDDIPAEGQIQYEEDADGENLAEPEEEFGTIPSNFHNLGSMNSGGGSLMFSPQDVANTGRVLNKRGGGRGKRLWGVKKSSFWDKIVNPLEDSTPPAGGEVGELPVEDLHDEDFAGIEFPVACEECGKFVMNASNFIQHMQTHSPNYKAFTCPHCPKTFSRKVHLQGHLVTHGIEKQYECPECHQRFSRQDCVKIHMRLHDKSKCVYCDVCHKAFLTVGALNIHLRIHRGEKPFKCHLCGKCFTQKNHLITHIKRHTHVADYHFTKKLGPRMFCCEYCPRSFIRLSDYERHVQWNHGAVADNKIVEKLPTMNHIVDGEDHQTGHVISQVRRSQKDLALSTTIKKQHVVRRPRKVLCTTSTQTDDTEGHVIVPRKYQEATTPDKELSDCVDNSITTSPEKSSKQQEEEGYEEDLFDEGMDRDYSSDEEDNDREARPKDIFIASHKERVKEEKHDSKDDRFDEVVCGQKMSAKEPLLIKMTCKVRNDKVPHDREARKKDVDAGSSEEQHVIVTEDQIGNELTEESDIAKENVAQDEENDATELIIDTVTEVVRVPGKRGRPRGPGRKQKLFPGVSGAQELHLIRKNWLNYVANKLDDGDEKKRKLELGEKDTTKEVEKNKNELTVGQIIRSAPRVQMAEPRKRRKIEWPVAMQKPGRWGVVKKEPKEVADTESTSEMPDISADLISHKKRDIRVENRVSNYQVDITATRLSNRGPRRGADFFSADNKNEALISPHVELSSFCIPTYSCKLCGREFRFEGKLHRHIESIHQNKMIFSPDVKPGRGAVRIDYHEETSEPIAFVDPPHSKDFNKDLMDNPEIAALRSEWDDEDDNGQFQQPQTTTIHIIESSPMHNTFPIVTRSIAPTSNVVSTAYTGGIKVNLNKLSGLLPSTPGKKSTNVGLPIPDSLDTKCRLLLEKLFDPDMLTECGIGNDHVSVVLGRVLQNYGVKMIEDYGQGQYEVLKYNLWRLIEWKVTMEQMEEFYMEGKSVEEMMDDIMYDRVPIISHEIIAQSQMVGETSGTQVLEAVKMDNGQVVISTVGGGQISLPPGVTQVVLAQDVSPDMLQGAQIVTIDPVTGQIISQVTADQVILADAMGGEMGEAMEGQVVLSQDQYGNSVMSTSTGHVTYQTTLTNSVGKVDGSQPVKTQLDGKE